MNKRLEGKRVPITQARDFMRPALCDVLAEHGAIVLADESPLSAPDAAERLARAAGTVDILVANLAIPVLVAPAAEVGDDGWRATFAAIVDPLPRLGRALLPAMIARRSGKSLVMSSATALRAQSLTSTYCSARGVQLAWAKSAGVELAQHNVQVNAIALTTSTTRRTSRRKSKRPTLPGKAEARGAARPHGQCRRGCRIRCLSVQCGRRLLRRAGVPDVWRLAAALRHAPAHGAFSGARSE